MLEKKTKIQNRLKSKEIKSKMRKDKNKKISC